MGPVRGALQGENYCYNSTQTLFTYLFPFSHKGMVEFFRGKMMCDDVNEMCSFERPAYLSELVLFFQVIHA